MIADIERLRFRRQYILAPEGIDCPFMHHVKKVTNKYTLYSHIDLPVTEYRSENLSLILLGDIFDFIDPSKDNAAILKDLAVDDFDRFLEKFFSYSGRYVLIYIRNDQFFLFHDASAYRKIFYCNQYNEIWFGSQPYLLAQVLGLGVTTVPSKLKFYNSDDFIRLNNSNLGDTTQYDEVSQLMPNHYFDVYENRTVRYWPNKKILPQPYKLVAQKLAPMIRGYVESIANRYDIMIPVTAGKDSRILAAASKGIKDSVYFYVNKEESLSRFHKDIFIPVRLFKKLQMDFNVIDVYERKVDEDFKKVYYENNSFASEFYLPHIYTYYRRFSDKVNLPGNLACPIWGHETIKEEEVTARSLAEYYGVSEYDYALKYYTKWFNDCRDQCNKFNVSTISLFYWEERLGNWGGQIQLYKDIANEDFNPYNSRLFAEELCSVDYRYLEEIRYIFHKEVIRLLWPDLLKQPLNPFLLRSIIRMTKMTGIYQFLK